ncbi:MAG TPA: hypothetical protein VHA73_06045 [Acidimicrobiales bacterium]|jgi:hypothetical protein|nr:hypothetical protein [Acidimicrobiales bacterium]
MSRPSRICSIALSLLIVAVLAAACSSGGSGGLRTSTTSATTDTSSTDTGATDTGSSGSLPSEADLKSALLSEDDLPSGFTKDTSSDSSDNSNTDVHAKGATCDAAFQKLQQKATKHKVTVDFKHDDTEFVSQEVAARSDASSHFTDVLHTLKDQCGSKVQLESSGSLKSGTLEVLSDPGIGEHSALIRITFSGTSQGVDFTSEGYFVAVQRGPVTSTIEAYSVSAPRAGVQGTPPDESDATALAESADSKIKDLVG